MENKEKIYKKLYLYEDEKLETKKNKNRNYKTLSN